MTCLVCGVPCPEPFDYGRKRKLPTCCPKCIRTYFYYKTKTDKELEELATAVCNKARILMAARYGLNTLEDYLEDGEE